MQVLALTIVVLIFFIAPTAMFIADRIRRKKNDQKRNKRS